MRTGGATAVPASSITVTPSGSDATSLNLTLSFGSPSSFSVTSNQTSTISFNYMATPSAGFTIPANDELYGYVYSGTGTISDTPKGGCEGSSCPPGSTFTEYLDEDIEAVGGAAGSASVTSLEEKWFITADTLSARSITAFRHWLGCYGAAWPAQEAKERCTRSRLI